ncbi:heme-binding protein [Lentzea sp. JNUCC 0626]|uniref:GlcG/HbpS family heme-binding protein n=1 Tax=Lentzea sp. JNUCC 0626 TaxID=3367513 RepID=UPI00374868B4
MSHISLSSAENAIEAGKKKAAELGGAYTISVVDAGGLLIAASRLDGAPLAAVETSRTKARTSALFSAPTKDLVGAVQPGAPLYGVANAVVEPLAFIPGGVPVIGEDGRIIGAIGVGGGAPDQDHEIAVAARSALH